MELLINLFCFLLLLFLALVAREQNKWRGKKLPPGPWRLPFLGSMHHLYGGAASSPLRRLRDLAQKYGPLMHVQLGQVCAVVVSSPAMAKSVLKTHDLAFASRPKMLLADIVSYNRSDIVFCPYGDYWRQMRKIYVVEVLSTRNVQGFSTIRRQEVGIPALRLHSVVRWAAGEYHGEGLPVHELDDVPVGVRVCVQGAGRVHRPHKGGVDLVGRVRRGGYISLPQIPPRPKRNEAQNLESAQQD
nr:premnaspirodiene oxygenase [Ipomoea batatas]